MSEEIKPCNHCENTGAQSIRNESSWQYQCICCHAAGPIADTEKKAREAWNRRATASEGTVRELVDALKAFNTALYDGPENLSSRTADRLCDSAQDIITRAEDELKGGKV